MITLFKNELVKVDNYGDFIMWHDLTDAHNDRTGSTKTKNRVKLLQASLFISTLQNNESLKDDLNFMDLFGILERAECKPNSWLAVD
jgi:hypothetical protein